jgi:hypothetical protein
MKKANLRFCHMTLEIEVVWHLHECRIQKVGLVFMETIQIVGSIEILKLGVVLNSFAEHSYDEMKFQFPTKPIEQVFLVVLRLRNFEKIKGLFARHYC